MQFAFSEDQIALRDAVRGVLDNECPTDALRAYDAASPAQRRALSRQRWNVLSELGAPSILIPESAGGLGLDDVDLVGVLEAAGWAALPEPLVEGAALAAPVLSALLPQRAAAESLEALVQRSVMVAVGGIDVGPTGLTSPSSVSADGNLATPRVAGATEADLLLLAARDADSGWQVHIVPAASCTVVATPTLDTTWDLATVHWPLSSETLLAYGVAADAIVGLLADRAAAASAAALIGLADHMITMAADYAKERHQFGKPIGSFQAVKHLLANRGSSSSSPDPPPTVPRGRSPPRPRRCHTTLRWPRQWRATPRTSPHGSPSRCMEPSATPGNATCISS